VIKLRAHEIDATSAINGLVNDINIEIGTVAAGLSAVAEAIASLDKRLAALESPQTPVPPAVPDAPVPTL
jgi:hypothetical protein